MKSGPFLLCSTPQHPALLTRVHCTSLCLHPSHESQKLGRRALHLNFIPDGGETWPECTPRTWGTLLYLMFKQSWNSLLAMRMAAFRSCLPVNPEQLKIYRNWLDNDNNLSLMPENGWSDYQLPITCTLRFYIHICL